MYQIGICDDGENICAELERLLLQFAGENNLSVEINIWHTGEEIRDYLAGGNHLDILFLDIELFKMTGIEVAEYIRNQLDDMGMQIIYISGRSAYARYLFKTQPLDFLVKPITSEQINEVMKTAVKIIHRGNERFEFQLGKEHYFIKLKDIIYFRSQGRKIIVTTTRNELEFYGKLKDVAGQVSTDFISIHKSYLVNREHIIRYTYEMVELIDGTILTISPAKRKGVRENLLKEG